MKKTPFINDVYVISDSVSALKKAIEDGASIVQLRDKSEDWPAIIRKAREILDFKKEQSFIFILNDSAELALAVGADGVHVGQDTPTRETRKVIGEGLILGKTTHNLEQAGQAVADGADYISVGPVYATPTKPGRQAVGLTYVREATANLDIPFVAIGGIDLSNIEQVLAAGAKTIGVVRAYDQTADLLKKIRSH
jgi:thiamine-phosphate pyrophosphorylase